VVVLTSGRWCSRGRLEDGRWRGEGVRGGVGVHGGGCPRSGPAPSPNADGLLSSSRGSG
jgi:hypothetical protein